MKVLTEKAKQRLMPCVEALLLTVLKLAQLMDYNKYMHIYLAAYMILQDKSGKRIFQKEGFNLLLVAKNII